MKLLQRHHKKRNHCYQAQVIWEFKENDQLPSIEQYFIKQHNTEKNVIKAKNINKQLTFSDDCIQ